MEPTRLTSGLLLLRFMASDQTGDDEPSPALTITLFRSHHGHVLLEFSAGHAEAGKPETCQVSDS